MTSKSIYEEAIIAINILCANEFDRSPNNPSLNATEILDNFTVINEALELAKKREKLLELYKELMTVKDDMISIGRYSDEFDKMEEIETDLEKQIKELEKE